MRGLRRLVVAVLAFAIVASTAIFLLVPGHAYRPLPLAKPPAVFPDEPEKPADPHDGAAPELLPQQPPKDDEAPNGELQPPPDAHDDAAPSFADFSRTDRPMMPADDPLCAQMPGLDSRISLIVKTGATESFGKIPTQLQTILRCMPDTLVFSDMEQTVAGVHVRDSLDTVLDSVKRSDGFGLYRAQQECVVSQGDCMRHSDKAGEGWAMDKYKNIHIAEKAYALRPGRDWYVVIDADTYLFWTTLVAFLARLDPTQKLLLGSIAHFKDFPFAHGGSGYIMSKGLMDDFVGKHPGIGNAYDERVADECCGDWMFSKAVSETSGVKVTQAVSWRAPSLYAHPFVPKSPAVRLTPAQQAPTINGDKIWDMALGPTHWCHPLATMHHVGSEEMSLFWEYEMKRHLAAENTSEPHPVLIRDMYLEYFLPRATDARDDWNNASKDVLLLGRAPTEDEKGIAVPDAKKSDIERVAHASFEGCRAACKATASCFQFSFVGEGKCALGKSFKIGYPTGKEKDEAKRTRSGWLTERIKGWVEEQGECEPEWPEVRADKGFFGFLG